MIPPAKIPRLVQETFTSLAVKAPYDARALATALAKHRGWNIILQEERLPEGVYGTVGRLDDLLLIVVNDLYDPLARELSRLHELGHVILEHEIPTLPANRPLRKGARLHSPQEVEAETFAYSGLALGSLLASRSDPAFRSVPWSASGPSTAVASTSAFGRLVDLFIDARRDEP